MLLKSILSINKTLINTRLMNFKLSFVSKAKVESSQHSVIKSIKNIINVQFPRQLTAAGSFLLQLTAAGVFRYFTRVFQPLQMCEQQFTKVRSRQKY